MLKDSKATTNFYSVRQAAKELNWKVPKVLRALRRKELKGEKVDWNWIIPKTEVEKLKKPLV